MTQLVHPSQGITCHAWNADFTSACPFSRRFWSCFLLRARWNTRRDSGPAGTGCAANVLNSMCCLSSELAISPNNNELQIYSKLGDGTFQLESSLNEVSQRAKHTSNTPPYLSTIISPPLPWLLRPSLLGPSSTIFSRPLRCVHIYSTTCSSAPSTGVTPRIVS